MKILTMTIKVKPISSTDEHVNSDDPNTTVSDSEISINSIQHHLSDSITFLENLNFRSYDCITRI